MNILSSARVVKLFVLISAAVFGLQACGGGGGGGNDTSDETTPIAGDYTLIVTVTGLSDSVVLESNMSDRLTISSNGTSQFVNKINDGDRFDVTIQSHPNGQFCYLEEASGTASDELIDANNNIEVFLDCAQAFSGTVPVTVAGYSSTTPLIIQTHDGNTLSVTADSDYNLNTAWGDGYGYSINVQTNPDGQLCNITSAYGPDESNTPTAATVTCVQGYSLGGTITNLVGSITLESNYRSGNIVTVTQSGSYTFPQLVADNASYSVQMNSSPENQQCLVSNRSARVQTADVTNIDVNCTNYYNIYANVTGLSVNESLSLSFNGGYGANVYNDGVSSITRKLDGTVYSISISNEPATQACTLGANTSGILNSDVTIDVTCVDRPYFSIGGSVTGLNGSVVLQNNAGDNLTIDADGAFNFTTNIVENAQYEVTVLNQPLNQVCSVINNNGTSTADVTNIEVVCGNPVTLSGTVSGLNGTLVLQNNNISDLTIDADGNFSFTESAAEGSQYNISVASKPGPQQCLITNGSGIASASVNNIQVTCSDLITKVGKLGKGVPSDVAVQGNYAYVTTKAGFMVVDVTNKAAPTEVAYIETPTLTNLVKVKGNYAYLYGSDVRVFDISTPSSPNEVTHSLPEFSDIIFTATDTAYFVNSGKFSIMDMTDPLAPTEVGAFTNLQRLTRAAVGGNYAYLMDYNARVIKVVDISNAASPVEVSTYAEPDYSDVQDLEVSGGYLYIAKTYSGVDIVNVSDPTALTLTSNFSGTRATEIFVEGNSVYVSGWTDGFVELDVTDPTAPVLAAQDRGTWLQQMDYHNNHVYTIPLSSQGTGVNIFDTSTAGSPSLQSTIEINTDYLAANSSINGSGNYVYVGTFRGLTTLDVSTPSAPVVTNFYSGVGPENITIDGTNMYLADNYDVPVLDISVTPEAPTLLHGLRSQGWAYDVAIVGNIAYFANYLDGLEIIDITTLTSPVNITILADADRGDSISINGNYAYVIANQETHIVDITDSANPFKAGSLIISGPQTIKHKNGLSYVLTGGRLDIVDLSDPISQTTVGTLPQGGSDMVLVGNYAYIVSSGNSGQIKIVDISNISAPKLVATHSIAVGGSKVYVKGNHVYVLVNQYGLEVFQTFLP